MNDEKREKKNVRQKVRGYATFAGDNFEFTPEQKGEPVQKPLAHSGSSKLYETNGARKQSVVAHLVVDAKEADPAASMIDQLQEMFRKVQKPFPTVKKNEVRILDDEKLKIYVSKDTKTAKVFIELPLSKPAALQRELAILQAKTSAQLYISEDIIQKLLKDD